MSFVHSKTSRVLVNQRHLSGSITGWTVTSGRPVAETTTVLDTGGRFLPGLLEGSLSINGLFNSATGDIDATIRAALGVDNGLLVTVLPDGFTLGKPALFCQADPEEYSIESSVSDAVSLTLEATPDDGVDIGHVHHTHTAETATANATSVDGAVATSNGGTATLHITAMSGTSTPTLTGKIQHSTDNSVWVDLITFDAATAIGSQRKTVTGTVNRYTRASWTISGTTPSFTFAAAFARR